jgi:CRISPR system Cascade subunit CasE
VHSTSCNERWVLRKPGQAEPIVLCAIGFEGVLTVDKPDALQHALRNGIGRGKSFGLGLLSLAPLRDW